MAAPFALGHGSHRLRFRFPCLQVAAPRFPIQTFRDIVTLIALIAVI
jgi:hypothetical protein